MTGLLLTMVVAASSLAALRPCPKTPNCVSTEATDAHAIAPIRYTGKRDEAVQRLLSVLRSFPRARVVESTPDSVRVEFTTPLFRFVDDAHFVVDDATKTIRFRSASRVGRSDLGVNRRRMEDIRRSFNGT
jgi:uncharacterized protein (DUF1499 family)